MMMMMMMMVMAMLAIKACHDHGPIQNVDEISDSWHADMLD